MIRTFIAVPLPDPLRDVLSDTIFRLRALYPQVRWVRPESIHLTLKFLGNIAEDMVDGIARGLDDIVRDYPCLDLSLKGLGVFPNKRRPRVIWVGFQGDIDVLADLALRLDKMCAGFGIKMESRPFSAHLTLGRLKRPTMIDSGLDIEEIDLFAREVFLYKSELLRGGARYTILHKSYLGCKGEE
ncbi:MAG: RNA 2',3'-cyclic phosphodiesterase [Thermodesulfobacteriota bacterium]|nr:RNA 2',3'-cyclic phosphodiesterase [Thermodesulfobacteriota bacterium]